MPSPELDPLKAGTRSRSAALLWLALTVCTLVVLVIVLSPGRPAAAGQEGLRHWIAQAHERWLPRVVTFERIEWSANVMMFFPLGFLGRLTISRWWIVVGASALLSAGVESFQHFFLSDRVASVADVLANVTGATLGVLAAAGVLRIQLRWRTRVRSA